MEQVEERAELMTQGGWGMPCNSGTMFGDLGSGAKLM